MAGSKASASEQLTTDVGIISFPHVFTDTVATNPNTGEKEYTVQFLIPKTDRAACKKILAAVKRVGQEQWGTNYSKVRQPIRDGDKEKDELTDDGTTKGDKYPERLGHLFFNAKSKRPVGVYNRGRDPITESSEIYAGVKAKVAVSFYAYSVSGNHGIGVGLNGVQKVADGEPIGGGGKPSVDSMFDILDDEEFDDDLLGDDDDDGTSEPEPEKPAAKKAAAKRAPAKKAAARKPEPEPEAEVLDDGDEDDLMGEFDDLDDE